MADSDHSPGGLKRGRSPSTSRSGRLHKRRSDERESLTSDVTPIVTPEGAAIGDLTVSIRGIQLDETPKAWRHKTARGIRRDRPRKKLFSNEELETEQSRRTRELPIKLD